jgi:hypothetical protein
MFTKVKQAWRVLRGKLYIPSGSNVIYVEQSKANNQFVQLLAWRDTVIALDAQGKIWELRQDSYLSGGGFVCQYLQDSPSPRYL